MIVEITQTAKESKLGCFDLLVSVLTPVINDIGSTLLLTITCLLTYSRLISSDFVYRPFFAVQMPTEQKETGIECYSMAEVTSARSTWDVLTVHLDFFGGNNFQKPTHMTQIFGIFQSNSINVAPMAPPFTNPAFVANVAQSEYFSSCENLGWRWREEGTGAWKTC